MKRRPVAQWSAIAVCLAVWPCGCGGPPRPDYGSLDLSQARGCVTLDGQPLTGALILFEAPDATYSYAQTDGRGRYRLMFNSEQAGVCKGPKTVRIWSSRGVPGLSEADGGAEQDPDAPPPQPERIAPRYNSRSELRVTVEDHSHTFDFQLES
jgi:hypothetical protein